MDITTAPPLRQLVTCPTGVGDQGVCFGPRGYMVVDHMQRLPEKLPLLYAGLIR